MSVTQITARELLTKCPLGSAAEIYTDESLETKPKDPGDRFVSLGGILHYAPNWEIVKKIFNCYGVDLKLRRTEI